MRSYSVAMVAACPFPINHGSGASIREMSDTLAERGYRVHIVTYPFGDDIAVHHAKIHRVPGWKGGAKIATGPTSDKFSLDWKLLRLLCRVIREEKIEIIHAHNYEAALIGIAAKWITRTPLLYNAVNTMGDELASYRFIRPAFLANWIAHGLDWFVPKFPDHITAVSDELRRWLLKQGVPENRVTTVPAGICPEMFENPNPGRLRKKHALDARPIVMYAGILSPFQRVDYALRAFAAANREMPDAQLLVVFSLPDEASLRQHQALARELGIFEKTTWAGPHPLEDLSDYLALADVCLVPRPDTPGHPVKLLNYMAAGKAIVTFAGSAKGVGHMRDVIVAPDHDCDALGRGIVTLLRDRALAARLAANAKANVLENFTWNSICRRIEEIYARLV